MFYTSPLYAFMVTECHFVIQGYSVINEPEKYHVRLRGDATGGYPRFDAAVAIASFTPEELTAIGNVTVDENGLITQYLNKPQLKDVVSEWGTTGGWAFFNTNKLFDHLERLKTDPVYSIVDPIV